MGKAGEGKTRGNKKTGSRAKRTPGAKTGDKRPAAVRNAQRAARGTRSERQTT